MTTRTIKDVDDATWKTLRELATRKKQKMGTLLKHVVREYEKKELKPTKTFVPKTPIISSREARELERIVREMRRESGFRG